MALSLSNITAGRKVKIAADAATCAGREGVVVERVSVGYVSLRFDSWPFVGCVHCSQMDEIPA